MNRLENKDLTCSLPVIPRLDRLDFLLQLLEEKHGLSGRHSLNTVVKKAEEEEEEEETQTLTLSSALEQVHLKGTLIERLTALENRVSQLSLEMDEGNTTRSSSTKSSRHDSVAYTAARSEEDEKANLQERQLEEEASTTKATSLAEKTDHKVVGNAKMRRYPSKSYRKWLGWLHVRC
ncbi:uncharacterized protein [Nicotiana sylvestris]|uniref:Uncharacterized protein LOC104217602 n=1 Tax=Nicotiana sylvestris TaxID=4096 RepID=A0A1U7VW67_NICSY|nr:PREDICTED: uncharacterized protein LOC104217602 [Nicotiana sylvestris]XP_016504772.1 PREDICTED: uncharacterized protein LOC107822719 [Nicotiana tabacum]